MNAKVKFVEGFKDGTIFPDRSFSPGEVFVVTQNQLDQIRRSGGNVEVIENVIANPRKQEKEAKREEMPDPQNADNSINDLATHTPGYEEELDEETAEKMRKKADKEKSKKK